MGMSKKNKIKKSEKQASKAGQHPGTKKFRGDVKPKKPKQEDHLTHIPFRLREIMKSKDRMKLGSSGTKKLKKAISSQCKPDDPLDGDIPVPHFRRGKQESEKAYIRRMENETEHVLFLTKNQVDRKPELIQEERPANKGKSDNKKAYDKMRLNKVQLKKLDKQEDKLEKDMFVDYVPFGEVTLAPPALSAKPKKAQEKTQKASKELLLTSLLGHTPASTAKPSMARQRLMEEERQRAVEAYRQLKKQKQQQHEARTSSLGKLTNIE